MTLVQASIAKDGDAVVITSDRLLSRSLSDDVPPYEFEANKPKIIGRNKVGVGFAGSQIHAEELTNLISDENLHGYENLTESLSNHIEEQRQKRIEREIERRTGLEDSDQFFKDPQLPIPGEIRNLIYGFMGERDSPIINAQCIVAGFDANDTAKIAFIDNQGDVVDATNFGEISIGSGAPFSTIYFDQHGYVKSCSLEEAMIFNFEAKKWAEAPTGVGPMTDMITISKTESDETDDDIVLNEYEDGDRTIAELNKFYEDQKETMREERKQLIDSLSNGQLDTENDSQ